MRLAVAAVVVATLWSAGARAHVGPSVRENNRYLKLTLLGNRARLLYTYYVGEVPGARLRPRLDKNGDGVLSDAEARAFGDEVAATVASNLELTVDGAPVAITWERVDVGLGTPATNAGAFSVDLVAWICADGAAEHTLVLHDHWKPPEAGETEVRVEESPGVRVARSTFGADGPHSQLRFKWIGGAGPIDRDGLHVAYAVDTATADMTPHPACAAAETTRPATSPSRVWLLALAAAVLAALALWWRYRNTNG